jgi:threonine synthase
MPFDVLSCSGLREKVYKRGIELFYELHIVNSVLELIGNTPLVRLSKVAEGLDAEVLVKLEYMNPTGSIKDRVALNMIEEAEKRGDLKPGAMSSSTRPPLATWATRNGSS